MALAPSVDAGRPARGFSERTLRLFCVLLAIVILGATFYTGYKIGTHHPAVPCSDLVGREKHICVVVEGMP